MSPLKQMTALYYRVTNVGDITQINYQNDLFALCSKPEIDLRLDGSDAKLILHRNLAPKHFEPDWITDPHLSHSH